MASDLDEARANADAFLKGQERSPKDALGWRLTLRGGGDPATARALSRRLAEQFISGIEMNEDDVDSVWKACMADDAFSHARRVLKRRVHGDGVRKVEVYPKRPSRVTLVEKWALNTSKDPDIAASVRHDWALKILQAIDLNLDTSSAETLGIAGGIWKRRWEWSGTVENLEQSLRHYLAPVERGASAAASPEAHDASGAGVAVEQGYPAINAAFIYDLLAHQTTNAASRTSFRSLAAGLRRRIADVVKGDSYWELVTRAEAYFGLRAFHEAALLMAAAAAKQSDPWEREATARQIARLGDALDIPRPETRWVVGALLSDGPEGDEAVQSVLVGKVGLALSGGGFRASLYHLGVLARLAESDVLRHVQVISTVSGGSIVGAAYHLRVKQLLETNAAPGRTDYVALVDALIKDFCRGVATNIRSGLLTDLKAVHAVLSDDDDVYAKSVAEALFQNIYQPTVAKDPRMADLTIEPKGTSNFHPRYNNSHRHAKVPTLVVNATTLNTGHSWQFTATSMGESPYSIVQGADALPRLRRPYYVNQLGEPVPARSITLSQAVAASACVPGLFAPLALRGLYKDYEVRLVDGGVYDNQGSLALLQEDCNVLILSDACGQLGLSRVPGPGRVAPLLRAFDIFQERMRQENYDGLRAARQSGRLSGLAIVHLTQDLEETPVDWVDCEDPSNPGDQLPASTLNNAMTRYHVWKAHQKLLAAMRTDLDVFSEVECAALMASGYLAMNVEIDELMNDVRALAVTRKQENWSFSKIIPTLGRADADLTRHLEAGATQFLRIMKLDESVGRLLKGIAALAAVAVVLLLYLTWNLKVSVGWIAVTVALFVVPLVVKSKFTDLTLTLADPLGAIRSWASRWMAALGIWSVARWLVPKLTAKYLEVGRLP